MCRWAAVSHFRLLDLDLWPYRGAGGLQSPMQRFLSAYSIHYMQWDFDTERGLAYRMVLQICILCKHGIRGAQNAMWSSRYLHSNDIGRTAFVWLLISDTPGTNCVSKMATTVFNLGVIAHVVWIVIGDEMYNRTWLERLTRRQWLSWLKRCRWWWWEGKQQDDIWTLWAVQQQNIQISRMSICCQPLSQIESSLMLQLVSNHKNHMRSKQAR